MKSSMLNKEVEPQSSSSGRLIPYLRVFLLPTLLLKTLLFYFGIQYSKYPGEGYGWGMLIVVVISVVNISIFLWQTWDESE